MHELLHCPPNKCVYTRDQVAQKLTAVPFSSVVSGEQLYADLTRRISQANVCIFPMMHPMLSCASIVNLCKSFGTISLEYMRTRLPTEFVASEPAAIAFRKYGAARSDRRRHRGQNTRLLQTRTAISNITRLLEQYSPSPYPRCQDRRHWNIISSHRCRHQ